MEYRIDTLLRICPRNSQIGSIGGVIPLIGLFLILLAGVSRVEGNTKTFALSEKLAIYVETSVKRIDENNPEKFGEAIAHVSKLLKGGADPDIYIHKVRGTALGASLSFKVVEPLFFAIAPYSKNLNMMHYRKEFPIELALRNRSFPVIRYLVERGVDVDRIPCCSRPHETVPFLYRAVSKNDIELVKVLLELGADIDIEYRNSNPLRSALIGQRYEMFKLLVENGATGGGFFLLHDAILRDAPIDILEILVSLGYGPWTIGFEGTSALEYARKRNKEEAVSFLEQFD